MVLAVPAWPRLIQTMQGLEAMAFLHLLQDLLLPVLVAVVVVQVVEETAAQEEQVELEPEVGVLTEAMRLRTLAVVEVAELLVLMVATQRMAS